MKTDNMTHWEKEMAIEKLNIMLIQHEGIVQMEWSKKWGQGNPDDVINSRGKILQYVKSLIMKEDGE